MWRRRAVREAGWERCERKEIEEKLGERHMKEKRCEKGWMKRYEGAEIWERLEWERCEGKELWQTLSDRDAEEKRSKCIARNQSSALLIFPSHKIIILSLHLFWEKKLLQACPMHECLAGKCETHLGPIMCPGWLFLSLPLITWLVYGENRPLSHFGGQSWPT